MTPALYGPEAGEVVVLSGPHDLVGGLSFERNGPNVVISDAWFGDNTRDPMQRTGSTVLL